MRGPQGFFVSPAGTAGMPTRRRLIAAGLAGTGVALAGCRGPEADTQGTRDTPTATMTLSSSSFADGTSIPTRHACDGKGVSPPLDVGGVPEDARALALLMDDPDANGYVHWLLWNVPPDTTTIPAEIPTGERVASLDGAPQGENDAGDLGYAPVCPPPGDGPHTYRLGLVALADPLDLEPGATAAELRSAIDGVERGRATLTGTYER